MKEFMVLAGCVLLLIYIAGRWVKAIDYMQENYPDYKGEDLFDEDLFADSDVTKTAGRDGWDDNMVHTEGDF